jgi:hypothetical protein
LQAGYYGGGGTKVCGRADLWHNRSPQKPILGTLPLPLPRKLGIMWELGHAHFSCGSTGPDSLNATHEFVATKTRPFLVSFRGPTALHCFTRIEGRLLVVSGRGGVAVASGREKHSHGLLMTSGNQVRGRSDGT